MAQQHPATSVRVRCRDEWGSWDHASDAVASAAIAGDGEAAEAEPKRAPWRELALQLAPGASVLDLRRMVAKGWGVPEEDQLLMFRGRVIPLREDVRVDMLGIEGHDFVVLASMARVNAIAASVASGIELLVEDVEPCAMRRLFQRKIEEAKTRAAEARARPRPMNASGNPVPSLRALPLGRWSGEMVRLLRRCHAGLDSQRDPEQIVDGEGGSYFLVDHTARRPNMAVLKPRDEEAFAPNNPKRSTGSLGQISHREGVLSGEAWEREVAACSLDQSGFIGVPLTGAVLAVLPALNNGIEVEEVPAVISRALEGGVPTESCSAATAGIFPKVASFQQFMPSAGSMDGHGFSRISVEDAQKVAAFDMFMVNADRHADNLLLAEVTDPAPGWRLVPIDHGLTLPHVLGINPESFVWSSEQLDPQLARPLLPHVRAWILERNVDEDASMLRSELGIREHCLLNFRIAGRLLQRCVRAGLTLREAVSFFCRPSSESPSRLETLADSARRRCEFQLLSTNRRWGGRSTGPRGRPDLTFTKSFDGSLQTPALGPPGARSGPSGMGPGLSSTRRPTTARVQSLPYESTGSQDVLEHGPPAQATSQPAKVEIGVSNQQASAAADPERTLETGMAATEGVSRSRSQSEDDSRESEGVASASPLGTALLSRGRSDSPGAMESSPASTAQACGEAAIPVVSLAAQAWLPAPQASATLAETPGGALMRIGLVSYSAQAPTGGITSRAMMRTASPPMALLAGQAAVAGSPTGPSLAPRQGSAMSSLSSSPLSPNSSASLHGPGCGEPIEQPGPEPSMFASAASAAAPVAAVLPSEAASARSIPPSSTGGLSSQASSLHRPLGATQRAAAGSGGFQSPALGMHSAAAASGAGAATAVAGAPAGAATTPTFNPPSLLRQVSASDLKRTETVGYTASQERAGVTTGMGAALASTAAYDAVRAAQDIRGRRLRLSLISSVRLSVLLDMSDELHKEGLVLALASAIWVRPREGDEAGAGAAAGPGDMQPGQFSQAQASGQSPPGIDLAVRGSTATGGHRRAVSTSAASGGGQRTPGTPSVGEDSLALRRGASRASAGTTPSITGMADGDSVAVLVSAAVYWEGTVTVAALTPCGRDVVLEPGIDQGDAFRHVVAAALVAAAAGIDARGNGGSMGKGSQLLHAAGSNRLRSTLEGSLRRRAAASGAMRLAHASLRGVSPSGSSGPGGAFSPADGGWAAVVAGSAQGPTPSGIAHSGIASSDRKARSKPAPAVSETGVQRPAAAMPASASSPSMKALQDSPGKPGPLALDAQHTPHRPAAGTKQQPDAPSVTRVQRLGEGSSSLRPAEHSRRDPRASPELRALAPSGRSRSVSRSPRQRAKGGANTEASPSFLGVQEAGGGAAGDLPPPMAIVGNAAAEFTMGPSRGSMGSFRMGKMAADAQQGSSYRGGSGSSRGALPSGSPQTSLFGPSAPKDAGAKPSSTPTALVRQLSPPELTSLTEPQPVALPAPTAVTAGAVSPPKGRKGSPLKHQRSDPPVSPLPRPRTPGKLSADASAPQPMARRPPSERPAADRDHGAGLAHLPQGDISDEIERLVGDSDNAAAAFGATGAPSSGGHSPGPSTYPFAGVRGSDEAGRRGVTPTSSLFPTLGVDVLAGQPAAPSAALPASPQGPPPLARMASRRMVTVAAIHHGPESGSLSASYGPSRASSVASDFDRDDDATRLGAAADGSTPRSPSAGHGEGWSPSPRSRRANQDELANILDSTRARAARQSSSLTAGGAQAGTGQGLFPEGSRNGRLRTRAVTSAGVSPTSSIGNKPGVGRVRSSLGLRIAASGAPGGGQSATDEGRSIGSESLRSPHALDNAMDLGIPGHTGSSSDPTAGRDTDPDPDMAADAASSRSFGHSVVAQLPIAITVLGPIRPFGGNPGAASRDSDSPSWRTDMDPQAAQRSVRILGMRAGLTVLREAGADVDLALSGQLLATPGEAEDGDEDLAEDEPLDEVMAHGAKAPHRRTTPPQAGPRSRLRRTGALQAHPGAMTGDDDEEDDADTLSSQQSQADTDEDADGVGPEPAAFGLRPTAAPGAQGRTSSLAGLAAPRPSPRSSSSTLHSARSSADFRRGQLITPPKMSRSGSFTPASSSISAAGRMRALRADMESQMEGKRLAANAVGQPVAKMPVSKSLESRQWAYWYSTEANSMQLLQAFEEMADVAIQAQSRLVHS